MYKYIICDKDDNKLAELHNAHNRNWSRYLSQESVANFTLLTDDPKATPTNLTLGNHLYIYRGNAIVFGGYVSDLDAKPKDIVVTNTSWEGLLNNRVIKPAADLTAGETYTDKKIADEIMKVILDNFNTTKTTGITIPEGNYPTDTDSITIEMGYWEKGLDAWMKLAAVGQLDFTIDPESKEAFIYEDKGKRRYNIILSYGTSGNVRDYNQLTSDAQLVNELIAVGIQDFSNEVMKETLPTTVTVVDGPSQQAHGLYQRAIPFESTTDESPLTSQAQEHLRIYKDGNTETGLVLGGPNIPSPGDYNLGDKIKVKVSDGIVDVDKWMRIVGNEIQIHDSGKEYVNLILLDITKNI